MDREKAEKLLAALIFDDLDEASKAEALAYLQQDDELRERLADMRMAFKVTSDAVEHGPAPVLNQQRLKRLARLAKQGQAGSRIVLLRRVGAVAAILIVGVSVVSVGLLPRLQKVRRYALADVAEQVTDRHIAEIKERYGDSAELMAEIRERYGESAELTVSESVIPKSEALVFPDDALAFGETGSQSKHGITGGKALMEENRGLGRLPDKGYTDLSVPVQESVLPAAPANYGTSWDSPAPVALAPTGPKAPAAPTDAKAENAHNTHLWAAQASKDIEALKQELSNAYHEKMKEPSGRLRDSEAARQHLDAYLKEDAKKTDALALSTGSESFPILYYKANPTGTQPSPSSTVGLGYEPTEWDFEDAPTAGGSTVPLPNQQKPRGGSAGAFHWSDSGTQSDKQQVPLLGDTPVTNRRGEELVTRLYDVSDLIRDGRTSGEAGVAYGESAQPSVPGGIQGTVSYGWEGTLQPAEPGIENGVAAPGLYGGYGGRMGGMGAPGGMGGGMGGMMGGMGGMMGGMGGMGGMTTNNDQLMEMMKRTEDAMPGGEQSLRGRARAGDSLARSKALSDQLAAGVTQFGVTTDPQSGEDRYRRQLSELSETVVANAPVSQPVDGLDSRTEGRRPLLGQALAPTAPSPGLEQVLERSEELPAISELEALSGLVAEAEPKEPALEEHGAYDVSGDGRPEEEAARSRALAADERTRGRTVSESQMSRQWRRAGQAADGDQTLGLTREVLTEELKAERSPQAPAPIMAWAEPAPSAKPATDPSALRQVYLDTKIVMMDKDELRDLGVEWASPTVQAGTFRLDDQADSFVVGQTPGQAPGETQIGVSPESAFTDALNMQLNLLEEQGEAKVVANPQVMAQEGKAAELGVISEEFYLLPPDAGGDAAKGFSRAELVKIESGTKLSVTPHVGDDNNINLDLALDLSDLSPQARGTDLPVVTRRQTMDAVAVKDGGTVVLRHPSSGQSANESGKEVAILITPRLVPQDVARLAEPQVQELVEAPEVEAEPTAPMPTDPTTSVESEEDGFDLPPASRFKSVPVNPWVLAGRDHLSTFALDVDTASYTLCRRYINNGFLPPAGAVRMEEFINAFDYNYPQRDKPSFAVYAQGAKSPFAKPGQDLALLKIGVKARTVGRDQQRPAHLVLVVDASASMGQADRLPLVQHGLKLMVRKLSPPDRVTLVTCAQQARLHLEAKSAQETQAICRAIDAIQASGTTNLLAGLKLGYATAKRLFVPGQVNHVVLCSDGVANVGQTEAEAVLQAVESDRKQGITITSVGVGFGTYNDELLEALANRGDGSYVFLDSQQQAQRVFVEQLCATLQGVAKDARIQVDFNAQRVRRYRLIGYENRDIDDKRFRDDTVDAGEVGSGQCSTALYEVELAGDPAETLGTVFVRYRDVQTDRMQEITRPLSASMIRKYTIEQEPRFFLAAGVARFAEWLRRSEHVQQTELPQISRILEQVSRALPLDRDVRALAGLARQAEHLPQAP